MIRALPCHPASIPFLTDVSVSHDVSEAPLDPKTPQKAKWTPPSWSGPLAFTDEETDLLHLMGGGTRTGLPPSALSLYFLGTLSCSCDALEFVRVTEQ